MNTEICDGEIKAILSAGCQARRTGSYHLKSKLPNGLEGFLKAQFECYGLGGTGWWMDALMVQVLMGELWNVAICGQIWQEASVPDLPVQQTLCFRKVSRVQAPVMSLSFAWWGGIETLVFGAAGGQSSLLWACLGSMTCDFGLLPLKNNSVPH